MTYPRDAGFKPFGLLVNTSRTFGFLRVSAGADSVMFDMRFHEMPMKWIALVVAILEPLGSGDIVVSLHAQPDGAACRQLHNTSDRSGVVRAELGEMILVEDGASAGHESGTPIVIEDQVWAREVIATFADQAALVMAGIDADARIIDRQCVEAAEALLAQPVLSAADQARALLLLGMHEALERFLAAGPAGGGMAEMAAAYGALLEDRRMTPEKWLARVLDAKGTDQAELLILQGLQRFPQDLDLTIQLAWTAHDRGDWERAADLWRWVMERFDDHSLGYDCLAACLTELGRVDEAEVVRAEWKKKEAVRH